MQNPAPPTPEALPKEFKVVDLHEETLTAVLAYGDRVFGAKLKDGLDVKKKDIVTISFDGVLKDGIPKDPVVTAVKGDVAPALVK